MTSHDLPAAGAGPRDVTGLLNQHRPGPRWIVFKSRDPNAYWRWAVGRVDLFGSLVACDLFPDHASALEAACHVADHHRQITQWQQRHLKIGGQP